MYKSNLITKAVGAAFLLNGILFGAWVARISYFKIHYDLSKGEISILLLLLASGAICAFFISSKLCRWIGAQHLTFYSGIGYLALFLFLGWSSSLMMFATSLFLFGAFHGAMDVAMNTWASELEKDQSKRLMPKLHAIFSLGGALGAATAIPAVYWSIELQWHYTLLVIMLLPCIGWIKSPLSPSTLSAQNTQSEAFKIQSNQNDKPAYFPKGSLLLVALIASSCALGEGAIADWASIYMFQEINSNQSFGAIAYSIFCTMMVISRLSANQLIEKLGVVKSIELCAVASCIGTLILITTQSILISFTGFALLGFGFSIIMPLAFSKAATLTNISASSAIATVATFAYAGMLLGPVVIGILSETFSLRIAFSLFAFLAVFTFFGATSFKVTSKTHNTDVNSNHNCAEKVV